MATWRVTGTSWTCRSGRRRLPRGLRTRFTTAEVSATDARPFSAARRPRSPPQCGKQRGAGQPQPRVVRGAREPPKPRVHRGRGRRGDRRVHGHVERVQLSAHARGPRAASVGRPGHDLPILSGCSLTGPMATASTRLGTDGRAAAARPLHQSEVGRRQGRACAPGRGGPRQGDRVGRPAAGRRPRRPRRGGGGGRRRRARHGRRRRIARGRGVHRHRARTPVRVRPRRNPQPLRPGPRTGPERPHRRARRVRRRARTTHRPRRRQRSRLPEQRVTRCVRRGRAAGAYRDAKARTLFETAAAGLGPSAELPGVRLVDDRGVVHTDPGLVLVSNNPYAMDRPPGRGRPALTAAAGSARALRAAGRPVRLAARGPRAPWMSPPPGR